jgi:hypothetical protein
LEVQPSQQSPLKSVPSVSGSIFFRNHTLLTCPQLNTGNRHIQHPPGLCRSKGNNPQQRPERLWHSLIAYPHHSWFSPKRYLPTNPSTRPLSDFLSFHNVYLDRGGGTKPLGVWSVGRTGRQAMYFA